jgi:UDP-glucose 4-epimerase
VAEGRSSAYRDCHALVTGGLGFIGSNLALRLVSEGARVTVLDSSEPGCGANPHNLAQAAGEICVVNGDIGDAALCAPFVRRADIIFNLAGEISHIHSMRWPHRDAAINAASQLRFLEVCWREAPGVRVVYASTRQIYGIPQYLPVDEQHPVRPVDFNGIHKYAAHAYHLAWSALGRIDARILCLTNTYGPRVALSLACQGFLANFLRRALTGQCIEVYGDGRQVRDPLYVDDAVEAFLLAGAAANLKSRVWNVGGGEPTSLARIAQLMSSLGGAPAPLFRPFPEERKQIDIGNYFTDCSRFRQEFGWQPGVGLEEGIRLSLDFFRRELPQYLCSRTGAVSCLLERKHELFRPAPSR